MSTTGVSGESNELEPVRAPTAGIVLVLDARPLRRAWVQAFLATWAAANKLSIETVDPAQPQPATAARAPPRLLVLSLGHASVEEQPARGWVETARVHLPETPVAVFSDLDDGSAAMAALRLGVRAFLPTIMEPTVVLHALSFLLAGGSFFPPNALTEASGQRTRTPRLGRPSRPGLLG